jgi:hypothetical protein
LEFFFALRGVLASLSSFLLSSEVFTEILHFLFLLGIISSRHQYHIFVISLGYDSVVRVFLFGGFSYDCFLCCALLFHVALSAFGYDGVGI